MDDKAAMDMTILDVYFKMTGLTDYKHIFTMEHIDLFVLRMDFDFVYQCLQTKFPEEFNRIAVRAKMAKLKSLIEENSKNDPTCNLEITIDTQDLGNSSGPNSSNDPNEYSMLSSSSSNNTTNDNPPTTTSDNELQNNDSNWKPGQLREFDPASYKLPEFKPPVYNYMASSDTEYLKKNYTACIRSITTTLFDQLRWQYYSQGIPAKVLHAVCTVFVREYPKVGQYVYIKTSRKIQNRSTYDTIYGNILKKYKYSRTIEKKKKDDF